jgi:hypothetical protein
VTAGKQNIEVPRGFGIEGEPGLNAVDIDENRQYQQGSAEGEKVLYRNQEALFHFVSNRSMDLSGWQGNEFFSNCSQLIHIDIN